MADLTQGFNTTQARALKEEVKNQLNALASKTDILADIEREVANTWRGPDADKYLNSLFAAYNDQLVPAVQSNFAKIEETIDNMIATWEAFQAGEGA